MGLLTPCFVPGEGFLYTIIVPGGGFLLPSSRVPGVCPGGGWFWMKLIPALETEFNALRFISYTIPRLCSTYAIATIEIFIEMIKLHSDKKRPYINYTLFMDNF